MHGLPQDVRERLKDLDNAMLDLRRPFITLAQAISGSFHEGWNARIDTADFEVAVKALQERAGKSRLEFEYADADLETAKARAAADPFAPPAQSRNGMAQAFALRNDAALERARSVRDGAKQRMDADRRTLGHFLEHVAVADKASTDAELERLEKARVELLLAARTAQAAAVVRQA